MAICLKCATTTRSAFVDSKQRIFSGDHSEECKQKTLEQCNEVPKLGIWQRVFPPKEIEKNPLPREESQKLDKEKPLG